MDLREFRPISIQKVPVNKNKSTSWALFVRRFCLAFCAVLAIGQLFLLQQRLIPAFLPSHSTTPIAAVQEMSTKIGESENFSANTHFMANSSHNQRLPTCLIIGVRKGGTRALLDSLSLHPQIKVARHEVHFFDNEQNFRFGPNWYRQQMPISKPNEVIIEKTPAYFTGNPKVPRRVFELNPRMKIILIVREPVTRTISDFTQIQQTKRDKHKPALDFQRMSFRPSDKNGTFELNERFKPIRNSLYAQHLSRWLEFFPLNQILVLNGDKFIKNPLSQLRLAEDFLGLQPAIRPDQFVFNTTKGFFCFKPDQNTTAHCLGQSKGRKQMQIPLKFRQLLAKHFAPHNQRFFRLLNRQMPNWDFA